MMRAVDLEHWIVMRLLATLLLALPLAALAEAGSSPSDLARAGFDGDSVDAFERVRGELVDRTTDPDLRFELALVGGRLAFWLNAESPGALDPQLRALLSAPEEADALAFVDGLIALRSLEEGGATAALSKLRRAAATLRESDRVLARAMADSLICDALFVAEEFESALVPCRSAVSALEAGRQSFELARATNVLGLLYAAREEFDSALQWLSQARELYADLGSLGGVAMMDDNLSPLLLQRGDAEASLAASTRALEFELARGKREFAVYSRINRAQAMATLKQLEAARAELMTALNESEALGILTLSRDVRSAQWAIEEKMGTAAAALAALKQVRQLENRIKDQELAAMAESMRIERELREREAELKQALADKALRETALSNAEELARQQVAVVARERLLVAAVALLALLTVAFLMVRARALRRENEVLAQIDHSRIEVLATAAHEIRNPVSAVLGLLDLALARPLPDDAKGLLHSARGAAATILGVTNDYLDHALIAENRLELRQEPFNLLDLLQLQADALRAQIGDRPVAMRLTLDSALPTMACGDPIKLGQILGNLLGNALKFTRAGSITLAACPAGEARVRFTVSDTGPGIPTDELAGIFKPYAQGRAGHALKRGVGLGLAISNQLVEYMAGKMVIKCPPDGGTLISFSIPLPAASLAAATGETLESVTTSASIRRVLVVEDDPHIGKLLIAQLEQLGAQAMLCHDVHEAYAIWLAEQPDLLLTDFHLGQQTGLDLARKIGGGGNHSTTRIVVISARQPRIDEDFQNLGISDWLQKPIGMDQLAALLRREQVDTKISPSANPLALVDFEQLQSTMAATGSAAPDLLAKFSASLELRMTNIGAAQAKGDHGELLQLAHSLRGTAGYYGATALVRFAGKLEDSLVQNDLSELPATVAALQQAVKQTVEAYQQWLSAASMPPN